jgi:sialic acid synthase SpsE
MSDLEEVRHALRTILPLNDNIVVLHCTSLYPTLPEEANLSAMLTMRQEFGVQVGYSDHTEGIAVPLAAVAMGAVCVEKHFTLDRDMEGPDQKISCDPEGFKALVRAVREVEAARGDGVKRPVAREISQTRDAFRKSIFVTRKVFPGQVLTAADITVARPALGISPAEWDEVVGKTVKVEIEPGNPLRWSDVA